MLTLEERKKMVELVKIGAKMKLSEMKEIDIDEVCKIVKIINEVVGDLEFYERLEQERLEKGETENA